MITIDDAINELRKDPAFRAGIMAVEEDQRAKLEAETIGVLRQMLEPLLPLINALHDSPAARDAVKRELLSIFSGSPNGIVS